MRRWASTIPIGAALALALAGCAAEPSPGSEASGSGASDDGAGAYPVTVENCGEEVVVESAPGRIVTGNQQAAEILIHLGVADRVVGTAYEVDQIPQEVAVEYGAIPPLVERGQLINHEALLEAQPDFFYSTLGGDLTAEQAGTREELNGLGIATYVSEFDCTTHVGVEDPTFELLYQHYRDLGAILGVPDAAEQVIAEQQGMVEDALADRSPDAQPLSVMWWYSDFEGTPWVAGSGGIPQHVSDLVGVENTFADADDSWIETSYDEIAARDPDVIIVADLTRGRVNDTAAEKIALLSDDPLTSNLDAVVNDRLVTLPGLPMDPSFGSPSLVPSLVGALAELR